MTLTCAHQPITYATATWKCGHVEEWPVNMLKNHLAQIAAKDCHECRAKVTKAIEAELAELRKQQAKNTRAALESRAKENGITADQQELREYFAKNGCE
jgi:hypothetical protein